MFKIILGLQKEGVKSAKCTVNTSNPPYTLVSCRNCELPIYITRGNAGFLTTVFRNYLTFIFFLIWVCQDFEDMKFEHI